MMSSLPPPLRLVVLGNPQSRRAALLAAAALRVGVAAPVFVSYRDFLASPGALARQLTPATVVRIEAPSEDWLVTQCLLKRGAERREQESPVAIPASQVDQLANRRGEIVAPRQWYLGLADVMNELHRIRAAHDSIRWMACPADIPILFDKRQTQAIWQAAGVPVPRFWSHVRCYDQLRRMERPTRLFIKLAHGYSAMGAMAIQWSGNRVRALTTVELETAGGTTRMYVSKRPRVMLDERAISSLFDKLAEEGVIVEPWLPKARIAGKAFDIRVVTIAGQPRHVVGRASGSPFTNLNLDACRVEAPRLRQRFGKHWHALLRTASHAASVFGNSHYLGLDLLASPSRDRFALLEANVWGDYLPGLLHRGQDTYEAELRSLLRQDAEPHARESAACTAP